MNWLCENLRFRQGKSLLWQAAGILAIWIFVVLLHWTNDGLWFQGDAPRHAANGVFWLDFLRELPSDPLQYALSYYARYPVIMPTAYPPVFYWAEAAVYEVFGVSPYVAKNLVLVFVLVGTFYILAWLRRWVDERAGWAALLYLLQPSTIAWGHAVMLNMPATALGIAALYHWRRWLESEAAQRHLYLAAGLGSLACLTYLHTVFIAIIMFSWAVMRSRTSVLRQKRVVLLMLAAFCAVVLFLLLQRAWAPSHQNGVYVGEFPFWRPAAWMFYPGQLPHMVTGSVMIAALIGLGFGVAKVWRSEVSFACVWVGICYIWFTLLMSKEDRYVSLIIPPLIILATIGIVASLRFAATWVGPISVRLTPAVLLLAVTVHAVLALSHYVPRITGFQEVATFLRHEAPTDRVFYDGFYNGVFSFYVRAGDQEFKRAVTLGSKLLYIVKVLRGWGFWELVSSSTEVAERLRTECGCRWIVVERQLQPDASQAELYLREAVRGKDFRLVKTFKVDASGVTDVDVYEYLGTRITPAHIPLRLPTLGEGVVFEVKPLEHQTK